VVLGESLRRGDPVEEWHLDIHDDQIRSKLGRESHRGLTVTGLANHLESVVSESFNDIEANERLVLGNYDSAGGLSGIFLVWHALNPTVFLGLS
jgi:hypothetical protein